MPDERILSGESLIRNLIRGYADARGWGVEPMRYGYVGDGWYHVRPIDNQTFLSTGFPTGVSVLTDGEYKTTFRIEKSMLLPSEYAWMERRRSAERTPVRLLLEVTLRKGERQVECHLTMDNAIKDHRLRVLFPTRVPGRDWFAGQRVRAHRGKPKDATFLRARSGVVQLSALKVAQDRDGVILRLFNPADTAAEDVLEFAIPFTSAVEVDHAERPIPGARQIKGGRASRSLCPKQKIRT